MRAGLRDGMRDHFTAELRCEGIAAYIRYCFELRGVDGERLWLDAEGFKREEPSMDGGSFEFLWPTCRTGTPPPAGAASQVYYQIFPERFANGDESLDPPGARAPGAARRRARISWAATSGG